MPTIHSSEATSENDTFMDNCITFMSWLEHEKNSVLKITNENWKNIELIHANVLQLVETNGLSLQQIEKNRKNLESNQFNFDDKTTIDEITNTITKISLITAQIEGYRKKVVEVEDEIALLKIGSTSDHNKLKSKILAYKKALQCFETFFDIKITDQNFTKDEVTVHMIFEGFKQHPITMILDQSHQILSFDVSSCNTKEEYKELMAWFKDSRRHPITLLIKLGKYIRNLS